MDNVEDIASRLIGLDSQSHIGNASIAQFITGYLQDYTQCIERIEYTDSGGQRKISLVAKIGDGTGGLALAAHMDTVPALGWSTNPFEAKIQDGKMYGLGTSDMKGALACTLVVASIFHTLNTSKPLFLVYTTDEETDTQGARKIVDKSRLLKDGKPKYCIVGEPTDLKVVNEHKAAITFSATAKGKAAHSSTGKGINANVKLMPFLNTISNLYQELVIEKGYWDPAFDPPFPDWNIVIDNYGTAANVTVPLSTCRVNFRYTRKIDPARIMNKVKESAYANGLDFDYWSSGPPFYTSSKSPIVQLGLGLANQTEPYTASYRTDACILNELMPCIILGPGSVKQAHTIDEWVSINQLHLGIDRYLKFIDAICQ